jgi:hypothetical protein
VGQAGVGGRGLPRLGGQKDRSADHLFLGGRAVGRNIFDGMAAAVAGFKFLGGIGADWVAPEHLFSQAEALDELAPVHGAQEAQAVDVVDDGHPARSLVLAIGHEDLVGGQPLVRQLVLDPAQDDLEGRTPSLEFAVEFLNEGGAHRRLRAVQVREDLKKAPRLGLGRPDDALGPSEGQVPVTLAQGDETGDAPQVLDQRQPQHDRKGPEFAEFERSHGLVGGEETRSALGVDAAVDVGDEFEGQVVDPRTALGSLVQEPGQPADIGARQMQAGDANLLFEEVEIIDEPFGGGRDAPACGRGAGHQVVDLAEVPLVLVEPLEQRRRSTPGIDLLPARQLSRVIAELLEV